MKLGINLFCYCEGGQLPLEKQCELMKQNGFSRTFCFSDNKNVGEKMVELLSKYDIKLDTLHAPFDGINGMWRKLGGNNMLSKLLFGVDKCRELDIPTLIVHLSSGTPAPRISDAGLKRFDKLMDYATKRNVKIAFENQRVVSNISAVMEYHENAGFCWDVGHETAFAYGRKYMPLFGSRLSALHIHDNHKEHNRDEHMIPFDGLVDFDYVARTIAGYKYTGTLMLELVSSNSEYYKNTTADEYYKRAGVAAKRLGNMVEHYRSI